MRNILYKRSLVFGIMILFVGLSAASSLGGNIEKTSAPLNAPPRALLAYWAFDEGSGTTAGDSSGHGYDGTIVGATWVSHSGGYALEFDGTNDYVQMDAYSEELGLNKTDDYTIMVSFQSQSSARGTIFSMSHTDLLRAYAHFELLADGRLTFKTGDSTCLLQLNTTGTYNDGEWHDAEVRFYGEVVNPTVEIWVDGSQDATITDWLCPYLSEDFKTAKIGKRGAEDMYYFDGTIDDVKLYKYLVSPPSPPKIEGPNKGSAGTKYDFKFTSTDPEGQDVSYKIEWDDGDKIDWTAYQASGTPYEASHTWDSDGTYTIKAWAKNEDGLESIASTKKIEIPRSRSVNIHYVLLKFLAQQPNLLPILKFLLGL